MRKECARFSREALKLLFWVTGLLFCLGAVSSAGAFTLSVEDQNGNPVTGFRWLVEEDTTNVVTPGTFSARTLGVNIHGTYAPVQASGHSDTSTAKINVSSAKRWFVSVLPDAAATDGSPALYRERHAGGSPGPKSVTVVVNTSAHLHGADFCICLPRHYADQQRA